MLMFGVTIGFLVWLYMWTRQTSVDFHILLKDGKAHITRPGTTLEVVTDIDNLDETLETLRRYYRGSNERKEYDEAVSFEIHNLGRFHRRSHGFDKFTIKKKKKNIRRL